MEERERFGAKDPESEGEKSASEEDVEAHRQRVRQTEEGTDEGAGDDDVELHRQRTR